MWISSVHPELRERPFTVAQAEQLGMARHRLRSAAWRRVLHGVYVAADVPLSMEVRAQAAALVLPRAAVVYGGSAAWLYGVDITAYDAALCVAVPPGCSVPRRAGVRAVERSIPEVQVALRFGVPTTRPLRTALDLACQRDVVEATVAVDAILHTGRCGRDELVALIAAEPPRRHIRVARRAADLAEPRTESPMETRLRLLLVAAGLPRPVAQHEVYTAGGEFVARVDLAYPAERVAIEYDGGDHAKTWRRDLRRQHRIENEGWWMRRYTAWDIYNRPADIVVEVATALRLRPAAA